MRRTRIIGAALVPTLTLAVAGAGVSTALVTAAPAGAAVLQAWGAPASLTASGTHNSVHDLKITSDGTAVTVWSRDTGAGNQELWAATRPAKSTVWSAPVRVAAPKGEVYTATLTAGTDGSATVAWLHWGDSTGYTYSSSTLLARSRTWTDPAQVSNVSHPAWLALAGGSGGRLVAAWTSFGDNTQGDTGRGLYVSERAAPGAAWSEPVKLTDVLAFSPAATVGADGTVTVAWKDDSDSSGLPLRVATLPAGATEWQAPRAVEGVTSTSSLAGDLDLQSSASGATLLSWSEGGSSHRFAYRPAVDASWGPAESAPSEGLPYDSAAPQLGPTGEVTAVWKDMFALRTATRSSAGVWSSVRTFADTGVDDVWSPSVGPDGTVTALWTTADGDLTAAARTDGAWAPPVTVGRIDADAVKGTTVSATGADGRAVVVWNRTTGTTDTGKEIHQVWSAATMPGTSQPWSAAKRRDYVGADGLPDLYARTGTGALAVYRGTAQGTFSTRTDGGTWPASSTLIPFGDLDGDGANDTLVRTASGELHRYMPPRGQVVTPSSPHTRIGTGWTGLDVLTHSGDFNADGRPDLVARQTATGDLYLYAGTKNGTLARTGRIGTGWKNLTVVGAGDLNNDKNADLLARTSTGDLYRYYGTGKATIGSGAKIGTGWTSMTDLVGAGDLNRDGNDDILARTSAGDLYRYYGTGKGAIGSGAKIGTGWKAFTSLR